MPLTEVKKILKSAPTNIRDSEKEVINYNQALEYLNEILKSNQVEISVKLVLEIHKIVTIQLLPRYESGKLRLLDELIEFVVKNKDKIDPLILAGIFHKQMVIIHPFMDGNGRTTHLATKIIWIFEHHELRAAIREALVRFLIMVSSFWYINYY